MQMEFVFDYFIPISLGTSATVITEESNIAYYKATHEGQSATRASDPGKRDAFLISRNS